MTNFLTSGTEQLSEIELAKEIFFSVFFSYFFSFLFCLEVTYKYTCKNSLKILFGSMNVFFYTKQFENFW